MERWDFDCQTCGKDIGDDAYTDPVWYCCPQSTGWLHIPGLNKFLVNVYLRQHTIVGQGWKRLGYCLCERCAQKAHFKCPICGMTLIRVTANQHPGGSWGIRGAPNIPVVRDRWHYIIDEPIPERHPMPMTMGVRDVCIFAKNADQ